MAQTLLVVQSSAEWPLQTQVTVLPRLGGEQALPGIAQPESSRWTESPPLSTARVTWAPLLSATALVLGSPGGAETPSPQGQELCRCTFPGASQPRCTTARAGSPRLRVLCPLLLPAHSGSAQLPSAGFQVRCPAVQPQIQSSTGSKQTGLPSTAALLPHVRMF